jgi:hypothetical protein
MRETRLSQINSFLGAHNSATIVEANHYWKIPYVLNKKKGGEGKGKKIIKREI